MSEPIEPNFSELIKHYPCLWNPAHPQFLASIFKRKCRNDLLVAYNSVSPTPISLSNLGRKILSFNRRRRRYHQQNIPMDHLYQLRKSGLPPAGGVTVNVGSEVQTPMKNPLPNNFTKSIISTRANLKKKAPTTHLHDKDIQVQDNVASSNVSNMYRVIETSMGAAYLLPLISTADSTNCPLTSVEDYTLMVIPNDIPEESTITVLESEDRIDEELSYHCKCCILLRKICKKQTFITDSFKPKNSEKKCECNERRYPKISKRLKLLVNSYQSKSWSVHRELQTRLKMVRKETNNDNEEESLTETTNNTCDLNDIAAVTSYQLKLTIYTNTHTLHKKTVDSIFSKFDPDSNDPLWLAEELYKAFGVDAIDLYKEFLGFLTAEQADNIDKFKDYFIQSCAEDLMKKIDEEVKDKDRRYEILSYLSGRVLDNVSTACEMCCGLLATLEGLPRLARYVFSLFPHTSGQRKKEGDREKSVKNFSCENKASNTSKHQTEQNNISGCSRVDTTHRDDESELEVDVGQEDDSLMICDRSHTAMDYEADHSSCGEDDNDKNSDRESDKERSLDAVNSPRNAVNIKEESQNVIDTPELTVSKTEVQDYCESTDMSMVIMSDSETVKSEPVEWNREEDKLILQVLMQYLTPHERKNMSILEIIEEKNVCQMISQSMTHKSVDDIKDRVLYLIEIIVLSES